MSISSASGILVLPFANYILNKVLKIIAEFNHYTSYVVHIFMIAKVGEINLIGLGPCVDWTPPSNKGKATKAGSS